MKHFFAYVALFAAVLFSAGCKDRTPNSHDAQPLYDSTAFARMDKCYFVASSGDRSMLAMTQFSTGETKTVWKNPSESVIQLSVHSDRQTAYFLTAASIEKANPLPHINGLKLYFINLEEGKAKLIKTIGKANQLQARWENENSFELVVNSGAGADLSTIDQITCRYTIGGSLAEEQKRTYDLLTEGYPSFPPMTYSAISPNQQFYITVKDTAGKFEIYVTNTKNGAETLLMNSVIPIRKLIWAEKIPQFVMTVTTPPDKLSSKKGSFFSNLFIFDAETAELQFHEGGDGYKNFTLFGTVLAYDKGFGKDSRIIIYDLVKHTPMDTITYPGGCGLYSIPERPAVR